MKIPSSLKQFLDGAGVVYDLLPHATARSQLEVAALLRISPDHIARGAILKDSAGELLVAYSAAHRLDVEALNRALQRQLTPLAPAEARARFAACETGICAPLGLLCGLEAIIDESLAAADQVCFVLTPRLSVVISGADFQRMQGPGWVAHSFVASAGVARSVQPRTEQRTQSAAAARIAERLKSVEDLPAIPKVAQEILQLSVNPYANATDLAAVIEQDPSLAAQLLRYANSPFYNYRGDVDSVRDAVSRVLGYDMVMDIALGIAVGKAFRNPKGGPLGLEAFWKHSTYCAALVQRLGTLLTPERRPRPGLAYLAGLLHNFGILLLGHLFPQEFAALNRAVAEQPDIPITELEIAAVGMSHMEMGAILLSKWQLPEEIITAVRHHHDGEYRGAHASYSGLVLTANRLLRQRGIGDEVIEVLPAEVLRGLGITAEDAAYTCEHLMRDHNGLDFMALQMIA